jgi:outer membrane protein assembly factor BamE (lipoprotein component of BamABCDE complex)
MQTPKPLLALALASLLLAACAVGTQQIGREIDAGRIAEIQVGRSTKGDVLRLFGPPLSYSGMPAVPRSELVAGPLRGEERGADGQNVFIYERREDRERFFTVLLYTRFRREVRADVLAVFFDANDVVKYVAFAKQTDAAREAPAP